MSRKAWLTVVGVALISAGHVQAAVPHSAYPSRPVRFVVPFPPGGSYDVVARLLGTHVAERLNQQVVVDNRPGAGGVMGAQIIAKATPDGHTIGMVGNPHTIAVNVNPNAGYNMTRDFRPLASSAILSNVVVVNPSVPATSLREFIDLAKSKPGALNYGSGGFGATSHLAGELLKSAAKIDLVHVPYNGAARALVDLVAGRIQTMVVNMVVALPNVRSGKLRALAIASDNRSNFLPDVPSAKEAGLSNFEFSQWYGVVAPAGTPENISAQLATEFASFAQSDRFKEMLKGQGAEPFVVAGTSFAKFIEDDVQKYKMIVSTAGINNK